MSGIGFLPIIEIIPLDDTIEPIVRALVQELRFLGFFTVFLQEVVSAF